MTNSAGDIANNRPGTDPGRPTVPRGELAAAGPAVRRYIFGMCGDWHEAQDIAQETLLRAWRSRRSFDGRAAVQTWIFTIARNAWLDGLRRRRTRPEPVEISRHDATTMQGSSPPDAAQRGELAAAVAVAMENLPPLQREVLALRESDGLTFRQIAELLDIPAGTVKSRVRYALLKLADELKPFAPEA